jgi:large subunit ribosomal protein L22
MSGQGYAFQGYNKETMAKAVGIALPVSTKQCVEICSMLRGRSVIEAKKMLEQVIGMKRAVPFKRYCHNIGHRKGHMGPGRYPVKACAEILAIVKTCEANAQFKGINTSNLIIKHICANLASRPWHHGRQARTKMKRTHVEVVMVEGVKKEKKDRKKQAKPAKTGAE